MKNPIMPSIKEEVSIHSSEAVFLEYDDFIEQYSKKERSRQMHNWIFIFFISLLILILGLIIYNFCFS